MSYCRFSCDNIKSDVYAYEAEDCFIVHVASYYYDVELPPAIRHGDYETDELWITAYLETHKKTREITQLLEPKKHEKEYAGKSKAFDTESEMFEFLKELKSLGYHVPDYAFDSACGG